MPNSSSKPNYTNVWVRPGKTTYQPNSLFAHALSVCVNNDINTSEFAHISSTFSTTESISLILDDCVCQRDFVPYFIRCMPGCCRQTVGLNNIISYVSRLTKTIGFQKLLYAYPTPIRKQSAPVVSETYVF